MAVERSAVLCIGNIHASKPQFKSRPGHLFARSLDVLPLFCMGLLWVLQVSPIKKSIQCKWYWPKISMLKFYLQITQTGINIATSPPKFKPLQDSPERVLRLAE